MNGGSAIVWMVRNETVLKAVLPHERTLQLLALLISDAAVIDEHVGELKVAALIRSSAPVKNKVSGAVNHVVVVIELSQDLAIARDCHHAYPRKLHAVEYPTCIPAQAVCIGPAIVVKMYVVGAAAVIA